LVLESTNGELTGKGQDMERIEFKKKIIKKQSRYDLIKEIADKLKEPIPKWLGRLKDIETQDIDKIYRSSLALMKESKKDMPFGKAWNYHLKEILK